jgi:hypothetical protein
MDLVSIKYTNISHCKTLQNLPKFGFLVWKQTIWQPWLPILRGHNFRQVQWRIPFSPRSFSDPGPKKSPNPEPDAEPEMDPEPEPEPEVRLQPSVSSSRKKLAPFRIPFKQNWHVTKQQSKRVKFITLN